MNLSEIKIALIEAHRNKDWEEAKKLSQLKQVAKRKQIKRCGICDCIIQKGFHCYMHHILIKYHKKLIPA